jgi:hypothetical protein
VYEVTLSKDLFVPLQKLAVPLVDSTVVVIERVVSHYERTGPSVEEKADISTSSTPSSMVVDRKMVERAPCERGVTIEIDSHVIRAISVPELYQETLRFLVEKGHAKRLKDLVPFSTSNRRYLIADRPVHPKGNAFVVPIKSGGYFMEAHKNYKAAIEHLSRFLGKMGLKLKYVG